MLMWVPEITQFYIHVAHIILVWDGAGTKGATLPIKCFSEYHIDCRIKASAG